IPLVAFIDETAAPAGHGLCSGCEEILAPPPAIIGSAGVASTIASQARHDAEDGIDFVLITSGARKADGNPHALIEDDAIAAERGRIEELAAQFFILASDARGISTKKIAALEAGIFLGKTTKIDDARDVGLVDEIISFDAAMALLDTGETPLSDKELDKLAVVASTFGSEPSLLAEVVDPM